MVIHRQTGFPGLRSNICTMTPLPRPAPPHPPPRLPAPCLHLTYPVFNPVSPTANSLNARAASGDTIFLPCLLRDIRIEIIDFSSKESSTFITGVSYCSVPSYAQASPILRLPARKFHKEYTGSISFFFSTNGRDVTQSYSFLKTPTAICLSPHRKCASNPFDLGVSLSVSDMRAL